MPVRHRDLEQSEPPQPKRCKHCDESGVTCGVEGGTAATCGAAAWRVTLDHDLVETLSAIYPEWFKPQRTTSDHTGEDVVSSTSESIRSSSGISSEMSSGSEETASSPMRESPPKVVIDASPLQPAMDKNKESLKVKLSVRRPINTLVEQGIIPSYKTAPAFYERSKQLERAKTGDLLKAKIQRRPDRQELERRHILESQEGHLDPSLAEKQRRLKKARLADQLNDQLSQRPGPLELIKKNILHTEEPIELAVKEGKVEFKATCEGPPGRPIHPSSYPDILEDSPTPSPPSPPSAILTYTPPTVTPLPPHPVVVAPKEKSAKEKERRKSKKPQQKQKQIKFHVYTGPSGSSSSSSNKNYSTTETSYQLLLQQQRMLEKMLAGMQPQQQVITHRETPSPPSPASVAPATPSRLEDMKVPDLKIELKRRNLRVSGPKTELIERLKNHMGGCDTDESIRSPASVASQESRPESLERDSHPSDDIVAEQRKQIEDLQRKLEASRKQIEEMRRNTNAGIANSIPLSSEQPKKILQAKIYESQIRAQLEALQSGPLMHKTLPAPQAALNPPPIAPTPPPQATIQPRYLFTTTDRNVRLFTLQRDEPTQSPAYIINGVEVVPIAFVQQAPPPPPPPPPSPPQISQVQHTSSAEEESRIMDDVIEFLVENGQLPALNSSADGPDDDFFSSDTFVGRDSPRRDLEDLDLLSRHDIHNITDEPVLEYDWSTGFLGDNMDISCSALNDEPMDIASPPPQPPLTDLSAIDDSDLMFGSHRDPLLGGRLGIAAPAPPQKHYSWELEF